MSTGSRRVLCRWWLVSLLAGPGGHALADVPLADAERRAKFAVPAADGALVYAYRGTDSDDAPLGITLDGRETIHLAPGTFVMWEAAPGQVEVTAEGTVSRLALRIEPGRVYYVKAARVAAGVVLQQVPFATGRAAIQRARLARASPARAAAGAPQDRANNGSLMLKGGGFTLADDSQTLLGIERRFDDSASSAYALEGEWLVQPGTSLGVELVRFTHDYVTPGGGASGELETTAGLLNVKRYFRPDGAWQPYLGIGIGGAATETELPGGITAEGFGPAVQGTAGLQLRGARFAARAEYKYLSAETENAFDETLDVSGGGFFFGLGFYF